MRRPRGVIAITVGVAMLGIVGIAAAQPPPRAVPRAGSPPIAVFRVEPLGLDAERAARLEALFRLELERLAGVPLPSKPMVEKLVAGDAGLRACSGEPACLAEIGKRLGVAQIVSGNVGELGDSYVINLKLVDVATKQEVRRVSEPLRGSPDELIETVRVAAYRLVSPEKLRGSLAILSDLPGAVVFVDGQKVGVTPLQAPIDLTVATHKVRITNKGYTDFISDAEVRFQKTTQVVVRMVMIESPAGPMVPGGKPRPAEVPWYSSGWTYAGVAVGAIVIGVIVGLAVTPDDVVRCDMGTCM